MEVYSLTNESDYFIKLTNNYLLFHINDWDKTFVDSGLNLECNEVLRFAVHQAEMGENVYVIRFPRQVQVLHRPDNLFFLERWSDLLDVSDLDHALIISIINRNEYDHHKINETYSHMQRNFKSFMAMTIRN